jgi:hypothetical protein
MTNTQRVTTVSKDSADDLAHTPKAETTFSGQAARPILSTASESSRQGALQDCHNFERFTRPEGWHVLPPQTSQEIARSGPGVLLLDNDAVHAGALADRLRAQRDHQLTLTTHPEPKGVLHTLRREPSAWDIVVVNVSDVSQPWLAILRRLLEASSSHSTPHTPLFLCTSRIKRDPQFQLALERLGVRFVYER